MVIYTRYAQEKSGQRLHIVPIVSGDQVATIALCGKTVNYWRMDINVPLGNCCRNCMRVNRLNGNERAKTILRKMLDL